MDYLLRYRELVEEIKAYTYVSNIIGWDSETEAPRNAHGLRGKMMAHISKELFLRSTSKEYIECVETLYKRKSRLDALTKREITLAKKDLDKITKIPQEEFVAYQVLLSDTQLIWEDAKHNNDFASFQPNLAKIIEFQKKFITYYGTDKEAYDVLLDDFEEGMSMKEYDRFFETLKTDLVPFVKDLLAKVKNEPTPFTTENFDVKKQEEFSQYLLDVFAFDRDSGLLKKSVHPFTWNTSPKDVRLTTRYLPDMVFSSIFATIHELGHALYEQQIDDSLTLTGLAGGASMGIHESQSRMYENIFGRSEAFWARHLPKLKKTFPKQLKNVSLEQMVKAANQVEASLIRVEADELTYPLHIMVRYDLERMLFSNQLTVEELPQKWNDLIEAYLGIRPKNDSEGVLQDVHWSAGLFGYFPTYALGSAYAAQIYHTMKQELNVDDLLRKGKIKKINEWVKKKIHRYGKSKTAGELLLLVTKEPFNPQYYVDYLKEKYTKIFLG